MIIQRISSAVFILLFLGVMFGSLFHVSTGMDMSGARTGCPFMLQQDTLCSMSTFEHLSAWQAHFTAIGAPIVQLVLILLAAALVGGGRKLFPRHSRKTAGAFTAAVFRCLEEKLRTFCWRPLQELFARGILHSKLFS